MERQTIGAVCQQFAQTQRGESDPLSPSPSSLGHPLTAWCFYRVQRMILPLRGNRLGGGFAKLIETISFLIYAPLALGETLFAGLCTIALKGAHYLTGRRLTPLLASRIAHFDTHWRSSLLTARLACKVLLNRTSIDSHTEAVMLEQQVYQQAVRVAHKTDRAYQQVLCQQAPHALRAIHEALHQDLGAKRRLNSERLGRDLFIQADTALCAMGNAVQPAFLALAQVFSFSTEIGHQPVLQAEDVQIEGEELDTSSTEHPLSEEQLEAKDILDQLDRLSSPLKRSASNWHKVRDSWERCIAQLKQVAKGDTQLKEVAEAFDVLWCQAYDVLTQQEALEPGWEKQNQLYRWRGTCLELERLAHLFSHLRKKERRGEDFPLLLAEKQKTATHRYQERLKRHIQGAYHFILQRPALWSCIVTDMLPTKEEVKKVMHNATHVHHFLQLAQVIEIYESLRYPFVERDEPNQQYDGGIWRDQLLRECRRDVALFLTGLEREALQQWALGDVEAFSRIPNHCPPEREEFYRDPHRQEIYQRLRQHVGQLANQLCHPGEEGVLARWEDAKFIE